MKTLKRLGIDRASVHPNICDTDIEEELKRGFN
jgi:hypothetical protein